MSNELIVKYLTGNCLKHEVTHVEEWLAESAQHKIQFEKYRLAWSLSSAEICTEECHIEEALNKVTARIDNFDQRNHRIYRKQNSFAVWSKIAAVATILLVVGFASYFMFKGNANIEMLTARAENNQQSMVELPDGTKVYLNANAVITYPKSFEKDSRKVDFDGEAFFEVSPDKEHPFIITATKIGIEVLGTSFNLRADSKTNDYRLDLKTGKVLFYSINSDSKTKIEQIVLLPGDKGKFDVNSASLSKFRNINENYLAWHSGVLEFNNTTLAEVIDVLNDTYSIEILIDPELSELKLTARFQNQKIDNILETLKLIFSCKIEKNGNQIALKI